MPSATSSGSKPGLRGRRIAAGRAAGIAQTAPEPPPAQHLGRVVAHGRAAPRQRAQGERDGNDEGEDSGRIPHEVVARSAFCRPQGWVFPPRAGESAVRRVRVGTGCGVLPAPRRRRPNEALPSGSRSRGPHSRLPSRLPAPLPARASIDGGGTYTVTPLVSDQAGVAPTTDPNLVNGWGISAGPDDALVGRQQRHRHLDALRRGGEPLPAAAHRAARRARSRAARPAPSSTAATQFLGLQRHGDGAARSSSSPRVRHDPGLAAAARPRR